MSINTINIYRPFEVGSSIVEWDIRRAGPNIIKEFGLLPKDEIEGYELMSKKDCDVAIGKRQIKDKTFSAALEQAFTDVMKKFIEVNDIDESIDVLSIKKDACFIINKDIKVSELGKYIRFIPKNSYHAYLYIKPFEFYFKRDEPIEVKGLISDKAMRSKVIKLHEEGILNFLEFTVEIAEKYGKKSKEMNTFLHSFVEMYKKKELEFSYYREFNLESRFRYQFAGGEVMADNIDEKMLEKVNIEKNYVSIILPLINLIV